MNFFLFKRLATLILTLLVATIVVFIVLEVLPGDPAAVMLGINAEADTLAALRSEMGLDKPAHTRYVHWLLGSDWIADGKVDLPLKRVTTGDGFVDCEDVDCAGAPASGMLRPFFIFIVVIESGQPGQNILKTASPASQILPIVCTASVASIPAVIDARSPTPVLIDAAALNTRKSVKAGTSGATTGNSPTAVRCTVVASARI